MKLSVEYVPITSIKPYENNAKTHPAEQIEQIAKSMQEFGNIDPIGVWNNEIVEGHGRYLAALKLGIEEVPIIRLNELTDEQRKAYALVHNKLTMNSDFDVDLLDIELDGIADIDMAQFGFELDIEEDKNTGVEGSLRERFLIPPFSVIYGNKRDWLDRKRSWIKRGIRSELGRGEGLVFQLPGWMERESRKGKINGALV